MQEYTAKRCNGMPQWSDIPYAEISFSPLEFDANITAWAQLCYDQDALYIRLSAREEHIRAEFAGQFDEVCEDSCLEFFFCPVPSTKQYINIECNPNGSLFLGIGTHIGDLIRLTPEDFPITPTAQRIDDGWETVYTIPYTLIRKFFPSFSPTPKSVMRANFYKCGDKTLIPHYLCWNPIPTEPLTFHNPNAFGVIHFE